MTAIHLALKRTFATWIPDVVFAKLATQALDAISVKLPIITTLTVKVNNMVRC